MSHPKTEEAIFCEALEVPVEDRKAYIEQACEGDAKLMASVSQLLELHDTEEEFLVTPAIEVALNSVDEKPGDRVGDYQLEHIIGEGGFGVVWQAQQIRPIQRRVALKIVKLGMDSDLIVRRFDEEKKTLALMSHPNIATVLDAGVTQGGRPFFAIELVEGSHIDRCCKEQGWLIRKRLEVFVMACRGVQHAHQKGVVHRDLKPSNILVSNNDDQFVPKVIDFGIATAVRTEPANFESEVNAPLIGTPLYMSPEQKRNEADIDIRSDIYSLGVVLYQLLAGSVPPLDDEKVHGTNPSPSQWHAKNSNTKQKIDQDLDFIIAKAINPERDLRYQSVSEFTLDIERYLCGKAVAANPGGASYLVRKLIARNKLAFGSGVFALLMLLAGVFASTWGMVNANEQRSIAVYQKQMAQENEKKAL
ncbi:MAG: serine/threonine-protein kinase, partial [Planctomycetota bacterium]